jgi:hypothetical protein
MTDTLFLGVAAAGYGPFVRHLRSIIYTLVLAPAVWILCGVGFDQDLTGRARDNGGIESLFGVLLLLLAGTAYAILLFAPISPLGPLLAGLTFVGVGAWARLAPDSYAGMWPANIASDGFDVSTPGYGLAVLLAVPLLATTLSARRWRGFAPPELLLLGTIGRASGAAQVAGTPMAAERTAAIPQQRQGPGFVPGFGAPSADATQYLGGGDERTAVVPPPRDPADDGDEKTTVMQLGRPAPARPVTQPERQEAEDATEILGADDPRTEDLTKDETTRDVTAEEATRDVAAPASAAEDTTRDVAAPASAAEDTTRDVAAGDETTRLVLPPAEKVSPGPVAQDDGEKTQMLTLPPPHSATGDGDRTQLIRTGTVEPPGDRTQLLTFRSPGEATTLATPAAGESQDGEDSTKAMSIVAAERPDPAEDPTTRLTVAAEQPTAAITGPKPNRPTVTSLERPADEAADDTRRL